jgi:predicted DsbA family dithiol-disulfide isomerase
VLELGLDAERMAAELEAGTWRERVARDVRSAQESGATGTPRS